MRIVRHHFKSIDSTNNWAKENAQDFEAGSLTIISTDQQLAGRGRLGRNWISAEGKNLTITFCFFLHPDQKDLRNLSQISSLAAARTIERRAFEPKLKWPNDIFLRNKKLSGVLTETRLIEDLLFIAVGIGINVNMLPEEAALIDRPVTSLLIEGGSHFDLEELLYQLQNEYVESLQRFKDEGFTPFLKSYRKRMLHEEYSKMSFRDNQRDWHGRFLGINADGSLLMELDDGERKQFFAGELL